MYLFIFWTKLSKYICDHCILNTISICLKWEKKSISWVSWVKLCIYLIHSDYLVKLLFPWGQGLHSADPDFSWTYPPVLTLLLPFCDVSEFCGQLIRVFATFGCYNANIWKPKWPLVSNGVYWSFVWLMSYNPDVEKQAFLVSVIRRKWKQKHNYNICL